MTPIHAPLLITAQDGLMEAEGIVRPTDRGAQVQVSNAGVTICIGDMIILVVITSGDLKKAIVRHADMSLLARPHG